MTGLSSQVFSGTLDVLGISEVLQLVSSSRKTGVLRFVPKQPELELKIALRDGRVVGVVGRSVPKITDVLLKFGVPAQTVGRLGAALSQSKDPQVLQTLGREMLEATLRWRLEFGLLPLWQENLGGFEFSASEPPTSVELGLALEPTMLEVARRVDELSRLTNVPLATIYNIAERVGDFSGSLKTLMPADWNLLNLIDGQTDVLALGVLTLLPLDELSARLLHLEQVGLIEPLQAQRGVQRKYTRLQTGDLAPAFTLPALDGSSFSLGSLRGKKTLLSFFSSCGVSVLQFARTPTYRSLSTFAACGHRDRGGIRLEFGRLAKTCGATAPAICAACRPRRCHSYFIRHQSQPAWVDGFF